MKVLLVHSGNAVAGNSEKYTFVREQGESLRVLGVDIGYFSVVGKGVIGYLSNYRRLQMVIKEFQPDLIHAHFGLCGALCVMQSKVPIVITCHNGETLSWYGNIITSLAIQRAAHTICVAQHIYDKLYLKPKSYTIKPCGIEMTDMIDKTAAQHVMNLPKDKINILFGGAFSNLRKNVALANAALNILNRDDINLIEMKGFTREQVTLLYNACDMLLLPTKSEGSPQVLKEAMAYNCPIVATDVADIAYLLDGVSNSYVTTFDPADVADKIQKVIASGERTNGRERILHLQLTNKEVAKTIKTIYENILP
ncbi:MAG: glycosyltransferase family 4 protein [Paludibacteraceae bacterium]|nr:glycosyltransferase family 4 protein [Paludibacteraceae bacterium]